jgi:fumarate hydratase class II
MDAILSFPRTGISGYVRQVSNSVETKNHALLRVRELALGGTLSGRD